MRILLDTHILLWALIEPGRLGASVTADLERPDNAVLFSSASIWELAIKAGLGRLEVRVRPDEIAAAAIETGFMELPVQSRAAGLVASLPHHHRDPFDRLLIAQAMTEPAMFFTADRALPIYSELVRLV